jgi:hypothetical protein
MFLLQTLLMLSKLMTVYHGTGNVAEDGWVATESGQQWLANRLSANPDVDAASYVPR